MVVRDPGNVDDDVVSASVDPALDPRQDLARALPRLEHDVGGLDDLVKVAPDRIAVLAQHFELALDDLRLTRADIACVAVLGDQLERDPLAAATDPERWVRLAHTLRLVDGLVDRVVLAPEDHIILGPHAMDDLDSLAEAPHPIPQLRPLIAVGAPLVLIPAGADAGI